MALYWLLWKQGLICGSGFEEAQEYVIYTKGRCFLKFNFLLEQHEGNMRFLSKIQNAANNQHSHLETAEKIDCSHLFKENMQMRLHLMIAERRRHISFVPTWVMMFENIHRLPGIYMSGVLMSASLARCRKCTEVSLCDPVSQIGNQTWPKSLELSDSREAWTKRC